MKYLIAICLVLLGCAQTPPGDGAPKATSTPVAATARAPKLVIFSEAALFEFGKAELKPEGKVKIQQYRDQAAGELSTSEKIVITGYTDNIGEKDFNMTLSQQRAAAVRDFLISLGADGKKFQIIGAGEAKPIADNGTEEGRAKNRRVEVEVLGLAK